VLGISIAASPSSTISQVSLHQTPNTTRDSVVFPAAIGQQPRMMAVSFSSDIHVLVGWMAEITPTVCLFASGLVANRDSTSRLKVSHDALLTGLMI